MGEREDFEHFARIDCWDIRRNGCKQYVNTATEHCWRGWIARAQSGDPEIQDNSGLVVEDWDLAMAFRAGARWAKTLTEHGELDMCRAANDYGSLNASTLIAKHKGSK